MRLVGSVLVRNEDVFVERAIRNVAAICDRIHVLDHLSGDRTPEILRALGEEYGHLEVVRSGSAEESHQQLQSYMGTDTWVLGVDGDELFDPKGLELLRRDLERGAYTDAFRVKGHVLNCDELDIDAGVAGGFLAPPSRPVTKLYNLAAVESWPRCPQRLLGVDPEFRAGFHSESNAFLWQSARWDEDPLRLLHMCFLRRSSLDGDDFASGRSSLGDRARSERGLAGRLRRLHGHSGGAAEPGGWKREWYRHGDRVTVDALPFLQGGQH